jgi:hypothetical protein
MPDSVPDLLGFAVEARDGTIGKIVDNWLNSDSCYIVVDTGWWIFERKRLIPAGLISSISGSEQKIYLTMTRQQVRAAPVFKPIEHSSPSGRYNDFYGQP